MLALSRVDNIEQEGVGSVRFSWLMPEPPDTRNQALAILERAQRIPLFDNTLVSADYLGLGFVASKPEMQNQRQMLLIVICQSPGT
mgnify:CR=1 FL=1